MTVIDCCRENQDCQEASCGNCVVALWWVSAELHIPRSRLNRWCPSTAKDANGSPRRPTYRSLWQRRATRLRNAKYQAVLELAEGMALLRAGKFRKAVAFVSSAAAEKSRSNRLTWVAGREVTALSQATLWWIKDPEMTESAVYNVHERLPPARSC